MGVGEGEGKRSGAKWGGERARQINSRSPSSFVRPSVPRGGGPVSTYWPCRQQGAARRRAAAAAAACTCTIVAKEGGKASLSSSHAASLFPFLLSGASVRASSSSSGLLANGLGADNRKRDPKGFCVLSYS